MLALTAVAARIPRKLLSLGIVPDSGLRPLRPSLRYVTLDPQP